MVSRNKNNLPLAADNFFRLCKLESEVFYISDSCTGTSQFVLDTLNINTVPLILVSTIKPLTLLYAHPRMTEIARYLAQIRVITLHLCTELICDARITLILVLKR